MHVCRAGVPVASHLRGKSAAVRRIFARVRAAVRKLGRVEVDSTKTRNAFAGETIFLELTLQQKALRGCLMLARRARHPCFTQIISPSPGRHYHFLRLTAPRQVDAGFRRLLREAYRTVGRRESPPALPAKQASQPAAHTQSNRRRGSAGLTPGPDKTQRPLWYCPKCGKPFANRNQWHSCVRLPVEYHFRGKSAKLRRTFEALARAVRRHGPVRVTVSRTRIEFVVRMRFAGVVVQKGALVVGLILTRPVRDPRFFRVVSYGPRAYGHQFRLRDPKQVDARLRRYLAEAYRVGRQEHLR